MCIIYIYICIRIEGEVRYTLLDFPGFSRGCGRAVDRVVEGGGGVQEVGYEAG